LAETLTLKNRLQGRRAGVLLHPTSLGGTPGCGGFGQEAQAWVSALEHHGIGAWQVLPLAPTDPLGSPYNSPSASAISSRFLDGEMLQASGLITEHTLHHLPGAQGAGHHLDGALADARSAHLAQALLKRHGEGLAPALMEDFTLWCREQEPWLEDHCLYVVIKGLQQGRPWWQWPRPLAQHRADALARIRRTAADAIQQEALLQWQLDRQWGAILKQAHSKGITIIGDMPFYVARDSSDVWAHSHLFSVYMDGSLREQSGVPPDYFSATGQLWGTPTFVWPRHQKEGFRWWRERIRRQLRLAHMLRIDHFRALESYWAVPGEDPDARGGTWRLSPGTTMLGQWQECFHDLPIIAEDLGVITPAVEELRDRFHLPGMKILQFAFDGNPHNPYLPHTYNSDNYVVFTGTHDNATSVGWWDNLNFQERQRVETYLGYPVTAPGWQLLRLALMSPAALVITPLQDLMGLGDGARLNRPGTTEGNWSWRIPVPLGELHGHLKGYGAMAGLYGRAGGARAA